MPLQPQQDFIRQHLCDDVQELLLAAHRFPGINMAEAVQQISGWQTARQKLPLWAATEGILYPARISMEQCSSQLTAEYKASIISSGESMTDLTAGFGVDAAIMSRKFKHLQCVERDEPLCTLLQNNLPLLTEAAVEVSCGEAELTLGTLPHQDLIYLDPARRNRHGNRVVEICECTPDLLLLERQLLEKADTVLVKLSPMLNPITISQQLLSVSEVHIVSVDNECKEILARMQKNAAGVQFTSVNLKTKGAAEQLTYTLESEQQTVCSYAETLGQYLYEPNASLMKAGCFRTISAAYGIDKLHPNSHLYTSNGHLGQFPGRTFRVIGASSLNKKEAKHLLAGISQANITVRNFPLSAPELRKRLKLADGGDHYIFATTMNDGKKCIILAQKQQ